MTDQPAPVDINTAGLDELQTLPGVGPAMAERILAARPFVSLEDLHRVSGVSPAVLERWGTRVTLSPLETAGQEAEAKIEMVQDAPPPDQPAEENVLETPTIEAVPLEISAEQPEEAPSAPPEMEMGETAPIEEPPAAPAPAPADAAPKPQPRFATRGEAFVLSLGALVIAILLASALSLSLLALVNGGLNYARPYQIDELDRQVEGLNTQTDLLQQDMDALRTRIDNLEGLSGRVGEAERAIEAVNKEMDAAQAQADALRQQVDKLDNALGEMQARTDRFQGFLEGLQQLLQGLFKP